MTGSEEKVFSGGSLNEWVMKRGGDAPLGSRAEVSSCAVAAACSLFALPLEGVRCPLPGLLGDPGGAAETLGGASSLTLSSTGLDATEVVEKPRLT
jgi:hypothetical protein